MNEIEILQKIKKLMIHMIKKRDLIVHLKIGNDYHIVDYSNINKLENELMKSDNTVKISRKYAHLFIEHNCVDYVYKNFIENPRDYIIIRNDKVYDIFISKHAKIQFMKRLIYINEDLFLSKELSNKIKSLYAQNKTKIFDMMISNKIDDFIIVPMMIELLQIARVKNYNNYSKELKRRKKSIRYFVHPFQFILVNSTILTVDLYSQIIDVRRANAITTSSEKWKKWFDQIKKQAI